MRYRTPPFIRVFSSISSMWDYLPSNISNAGDVSASWTSDAIAECRSRGLESTRSSSRHMRKKVLSDAIDGRHVASQGGVDLHRMALIKSRSTASKMIRGFIGRSRFITISAHQRGTRGHIWCIGRDDARSPRNHGSFDAQSCP